MHFISYLTAAADILHETDLVLSKSSFDCALAVLDFDGVPSALAEGRALLLLVAVATALGTGAILGWDPGPGTASIENESHLLAMRPDIDGAKVL